MSLREQPQYDLRGLVHLATERTSSKKLNEICVVFELFETYFWETATAMVNVIIPILAIFLVFRLAHDLLFRERL